MKKATILFLAFWALSINAQGSTDTTKSAQKNSFRVCLFQNTWNILEYEQKPGFEFFPVTPQGKGIGLIFERNLSKGFFYRAGMDYSSINIDLLVEFNRNDYPMFFEQDTMREYSGTGFRAFFRNHNLNLSFLLGRNWTYKTHHQFNTSIGLGYSRFYLTDTQELIFLENPITEPRLIAVFTLTNIRYGMNYIPFCIDYINTKHKIHYGAGFSLNYGISKFGNYYFEYDQAIVLFPQTSQVERFGASLKNQYYGLRLFVGF
jgi:hypothetical protein